MLLSDKESDRGCVIFGAAILEDGLEQLLRAVCRTDSPSTVKIVDSLFQTYAPFSTFSAKIQVTYALGLIPKDLKEILDLVRKLRNEFAIMLVTAFKASIAVRFVNKQVKPNGAGCRHCA